MTTNTDTTAASGAASLGPIQRFNLRVGIVNPEANGLYVRYVDHVDHVEAARAAAPAAQEAEPAWLAEVTGRLQSLAALKKRSDSMPVMHEIQWLTSLRNRMVATPRPQADVVKGWPAVSSVGRDEGHSRALMVYFADTPTNDEMRAVHEALRAPAAPTAAVLEKAFRAGWAACRDAEYVGQEAEDEAWGASATNGLAIDIEQQAPAAPAAAAEGGKTHE